MGPDLVKARDMPRPLGLPKEGGELRGPWLFYEILVEFIVNAR
jgi:hypothetical protein